MRLFILRDVRTNNIAELLSTTDLTTADQSAASLALYASPPDDIDEFVVLP